MSQTTYNDAPASGQPGDLLDDVGAEVVTMYSETPLKAGTLIQRGTTEGQAKYIAAVVDDPDSIKTNGASSAVAQSLVAADFNGVIGDDPIVPAQRISITFSAHADWDETLADIWYEDDAGRLQHDIINVPDGGGATYSTRRPASRAVQLDIPPQSGAGGTFTMGTLNDDEMELGRNNFPGIVLNTSVQEPTTEVVIAGVTADYGINKPVPVAVAGRVQVEVEAATTVGSPVYVRMTEASPDIRGQFRGTPAVGFARFPGARFVKGAAMDGIAAIQL